MKNIKKMPLSWKLRAYITFATFIFAAIALLLRLSIEIIIGILITIAIITLGIRLVFRRK